MLTKIHIFSALVFSNTVLISVACVSSAKGCKLSLEDQLQLLIKRYFEVCDLIFSEDSRHSIANTDASFINLIPLTSVRYSLLLDSYSDSHAAFTVPVRKYSQCLLILTVMNQGTFYLSRFAALFLQNFAAPTKANEDYYIFITFEKYIEPILNSSTGKLIKYKIIIPTTISHPCHSGFAFCFYCSVGRGSQVVTIDLVNSTLLEEIFPDFTLNGHKYVMRTSSPTKYQFTTEIQEIDGKWELTRGISKSIMDGVLPHYNFTYIVFSSPNGDTGAPNENGTWNGCIGQLLSGEADLSLTTSANHVRFLVIGFSTAAFYAWVSFTVGQPKITYSWKAVFWPFTKELWLAVIVSLLVVIFVFKAFERFDTKNESSVRGRSTLYKHLVSDIAFTLIGKSVGEPEATYSRILLSLWLLSALVINSLYNSKIVGLLAQPVYESVPRTFEDLADSKFSVGMDLSGGSLYTYFQTSTSPIFQKIFRKFEKPKETVSCFEATTKSSFSCITWGGVADYIAWRNFTIVNGQSPFLRASDITYFVACGLAMPRNAVYKPNFDKTISMIYDTGHGNRWIMDDLEQLQRNFLRWQRGEELNKTFVKYGDNGLVILKLSNILGIFYIFGVGHTVAVLGFIAEKVLSLQSAKNFMLLVH